jgi:hypothetical protein
LGAASPDEVPLSAGAASELPADPSSEAIPADPSSPPEDDPVEDPDDDPDELSSPASPALGGTPSTAPFPFEVDEHPSVASVAKAKTKTMVRFMIISRLSSRVTPYLSAAPRRAAT